MINELAEPLLDIIIAAVKGSIEVKIDATKDAKVNYQYILGQSIRQWKIPNDNWHTSKAARAVWNLLTDNDIKYRDYKEQFVCKCKNPIEISTFPGTARRFEAIIHKNFTSEHIVRGKDQKDKKYAYNEVFITEHTTPVSDIISALKESYKKHDKENTLNNLNDEFTTILNKIHKTQMLKIEDRRILNCQSRIPIVLNQLGKHEDGIYKYLIESKSDDVFNDIINVCYKDLQFESRSSFDLNRYLGMIKYTKLEDIPFWAKALNLEKPYSIEIAVNE